MLLKWDLAWKYFSDYTWPVLSLKTDSDDQDSGIYNLMPYVYETRYCEVLSACHVHFYFILLAVDLLCIAYRQSIGPMQPT